MVQLLYLFGRLAQPSAQQPVTPTWQPAYITVAVKDANGCTYSTSVTINNTGGPTAIASTVSDASCGNANGSLTLGTVTGGIAPYTYSVDGSAFTATTTYPNLSATIHTVAVKDANGCTYSTSVTINNTGGPTAIASTVYRCKLWQRQRQPHFWNSNRWYSTIYLFGRRLSLYCNYNLSKSVSYTTYRNCKRRERLYVFHFSNYQ